MRGNLASRIIALTLVILFPVSLTLAEANGALLNCKRAVVNGTPVTGSTAIFSGDTVKNGESVSSLTAEGSSVVVSENATLTYQGRMVALARGSAVIKTASKMGATFEGMTITPVSGNARFLLSNANGAPMVAALDGSLTISNGEQEVVLPAGKMMTKMPADPQAGGGAGGAGAAGGIPGWAIAAVASTAVGGALGGLAAAGVIGGTPASPAKP